MCVVVLQLPMVLFQRNNGLFTLHLEATSSHPVSEQESLELRTLRQFRLILSPSSKKFGLNFISGVLGSVELLRCHFRQLFPLRVAFRIVPIQQM